LVTMFLHDSLGIDLLSDPSWLYGFLGLTIVYTYFQIPLMLIVFLPSLDGLRQEWYDASSSLGGDAWSFWRYVSRPHPSRRAHRHRVLSLRSVCRGGQPWLPDHHDVDRLPALQRGGAGPGERGQGSRAGHDHRDLDGDADLRVDPAPRVAVGPMTSPQGAQLS